MLAPCAGTNAGTNVRACFMSQRLRPVSLRRTCAWSERTAMPWCCAADGRSDMCDIVCHFHGAGRIRSRGRESHGAKTTLSQGALQGALSKFVAPGSRALRLLCKPRGSAGCWIEIFRSLIFSVRGGGAGLGNLSAVTCTSGFHRTQLHRCLFGTSPRG